jgi:UDP-N-acetylmuramoyl-tripeptide--D-alanyl-D-alanine ligase
MEIDSLYSIFNDSDGVSTDSRTTLPNQLFFALSGNNFNGNQFAEAALLKGARYAIIDDQKFKNNSKCILVPDALLCMQQLAIHHRSKLNIPILAITGSNGKTTTKELIRAVLGKKYNVAYTSGNLNNHIGVPLTLLRLTNEHEIAVVEMGANHIKEIEKLCQIAQPDFGIINNIGKAHLEGFGSFEGVIRAKSELYDFCKKNNKQIFVNGDDDLLMGLSEGMQRTTYGKAQSNQHFAGLISANPCLRIKWNDFDIQTKLVGEYNFYNVMAAISAGKHFDVPEKEIALALSEYMPTNNRSQLTITPNNTLVIDAYNANPSSMELSIRNFSKLTYDNKMLIVGDMFELGNESKLEHGKIIELAQSLQFEHVILVGTNFFELKPAENYTFFQNVNDLMEFLRSNKVAGFTILLKASRGIQLEKIIPLL